MYLPQCVKNLIYPKMFDSKYPKYDDPLSCDPYNKIWRSYFIVCTIYYSIELYPFTVYCGIMKIKKLAFILLLYWNQNKLLKYCL